MRYLISALLFVLSTLAATAQSYTHIGVKQGLSNPKVYGIQKDYKGYMWFLTNDGIDRYNGKEIKPYLLHNNDEYVKSTHNMNWLLKDSEGIIWEVGKKGRVFRYDKNCDRFTMLFQVPPTQAQKPYSSSILSSSFIDPDDNLWLCRDTTDIYLYDIQQGTTTVVDNCFGEEISCCTPIGNGRYFIGTDKGVREATLQDNRMKAVENKVLDRIQAQINQIFYDPQEQKLYIGTFRKGFYIYLMEKNTIVTPKLNTSNVSITRILPFDEDDILIGTDGSGLMKMNTHTYTIEPYVSSYYGHNYETNGSCILDFYIDEERRIWMANYPYDVTVRHNKYSHHNWVKHSPGNKQSLNNDNVNAIIEDHEGDLWFATNNGISLYYTQAKRWRHFLTSEEDNNPQNRTFLTLCEARPGVIWSGGYSSGIYQINKYTGHTNILQQEEYEHRNIKPDKYIRVIKKSSDGKVWAGGYYNLMRLDPVHKSLTTYPNMKAITDIVEQDETHMWIASADGLYQLYTETGVYRRVIMPVEDSYINCLYQSPDRRLYIGTDGSGLLIYDLTSHSFKVFNTANSALISNNISAILSKKNGTILLSSDKGISHYAHQTSEFTNWTREQGLKASYFNPSSGVRIDNNYFMFGGTDGVIEFDENLSLPKNFSSKMVLNDFQLSNQKMHPCVDGSPLERNIDETKRLVLKGTQNFFSLKVSSINYDYPSDILYTWRLLGFYDKWSEPDTENTIQFTNLNPGQYTLQIRSVSNENWNRIFETREISIRVKRPWWSSNLAIVCYLLILSGVLYSLIRMIILRKEKKESNQKINFFINTAHDIRTPLTLIKVPLEEMKEKEELTERGLENTNTALKNVNILLNMTNNLLNFEQSHDFAKKLKLYKFELNAYMNDVCALFKLYANVKSIQFTFESNFDTCYVWFDKDKMDSIIKNLLSNALKYTNEKGSIHVVVTELENNWTLRVSDDGIGIPENEQKHLFRVHMRGSNAINSKITGSGIGLILVSRLVRSHRGTIEVKSTLNQGTTFLLTFPKEDKKLMRYRMENCETEEKNNIETVPPELPKKKEKEHTDNENADRLLIVEDNDELRRYLQGSLSEYYNVETAANGKEGIETTRTFKPDLIISDIMMPEMRGDEMCQLLKNDLETSHIPIILLTALNDEQYMLSSLEYGADDFMIKPFKTCVLKAKIANLLENRKRLKKKYANAEITEKPTDNLTDTASHLDVEFLSKIKTLVEENMSRPEFNVDTLCSLMNMSRTSFYNKLKALTDQGPADYVRVIKLKKAAELLQEETHSITEIAELTGFSDAKYFRQVFKKYFHVSPSHYMKEDNKTE